MYITLSYINKVLNALYELERTIELETEMPTEFLKSEVPTKFYLSKGHIKKVLIRSGVIALGYIILMFLILPYFFPSDWSHLAYLYHTVVFVMGVGYWFDRSTRPIMGQPIITINKTCIQFGFEEEGFKVPLENIALAEIKKNIFGRKQLNLVYTKELTYKIKHPLHVKMLFMFESRKARWSQKWQIKGLSVEPEELVQSIHFHLERYIAMEEKYKAEAKLSNIKMELSKPEDRYNSLFFSDRLSKGKS